MDRAVVFGAVTACRGGEPIPGKGNDAKTGVAVTEGWVIANKRRGGPEDFGARIHLMAHTASTAWSQALTICEPRQMRVLFPVAPPTLSRYLDKLRERGTRLTVRPNSQQRLQIKSIRLEDLK